MTTFKAGDRVESIGGGMLATVVGTTESVTVKWDGYNVHGTWPATGFKLARKFKAGDWVRIVAAEDVFHGKIGFVIEDDGGPEDEFAYEVGFFEHATDDASDLYSASELVLWVPEVGERVIEVGEEDEFGTIVAVSGDSADVLWDTYALSQTFLLSELEPAVEEQHVLKVGDRVEYVNPIFTTSPKGKIDAIEENGIRLIWDNPNFLQNGIFPADAISKIAA